MVVNGRVFLSTRLKSVNRHSKLTRSSLESITGVRHPAKDSTCVEKDRGGRWTLFVLCDGHFLFFVSLSLYLSLLSSWTISAQGVWGLYFDTLPVPLTSTRLIKWAVPFYLSPLLSLLVCSSDILV